MPFTPDSAKSKVDKFFKMTNWGKLNNTAQHSKVLFKSTVQQFSNEWSHFSVLSVESKVRKLCIIQGLTLGVKGLVMEDPSFKTFS